MLVAAGVVVSALSGCSETLDDEKVEDFLLDNAQAPALIESIDCPSDVEVDEGGTFDCEGTDVKIIPENVEALIRRQASEPERIVSVDCPNGIEIEKGSTFRCVVRFADGTQTKVAIIQRDDLGNVAIKP